MLQSILRESFHLICVGMILATFVRTFIVQSFTIPSQSMEDVLLVGDYVAVSKFSLAPAGSAIEASLLPLADIRRGDVIVFRYPRDANRTFVKRVIGLPGETVVLRSENVYIDERPLSEPYVKFDYPREDYATSPAELPIEYGPRVIPPGHYFVLGDNRDRSSDSRYWGTVPREYVTGKVMFIYFSVAESSGTILTRVRWSRLPSAVR